MIRRFGANTVNQYCPEEDRKLISNIRKTKERNKRHKDAVKAAGAEGSGEEGEAQGGKKKGRFESEYDEAIYGSDDGSDGSDVSDNEVLGKTKKGAKKGGKTYIVEDEDEPLDLLDRRALANISSTKPLKQRTPGKTKAKLDLDGKLLLGGDSDDDAMVLDTPADDNGDDEGGVGAYVKAIKGRDAVQRGRGGRLKFSNKRGNDGDDEMDVDEGDLNVVKKQIGGNSRNEFRGGGGRGGQRGGRGGRGGIATGRRGLGEEKRHGNGGHRGGGRVMKSPRGKGNRR
jgi:ribosomal RNA-processing protein 12